MDEYTASHGMQPFLSSQGGIFLRAKALLQGNA
jgi:hypothetical protein